MLILELKTAAICLIDAGVSADEAITKLYRFMNKEGIRYPNPDSPLAIQMWSEATKRATLSTCSQLLRPTSYRL